MNYLVSSLLLAVFFAPTAAFANQIDGYWSDRNTGTIIQIKSDDTAEPIITKFYNVTYQNPTCVLNKTLTKAARNSIKHSKKIDLSDGKLTIYSYADNQIAQTFKRIYVLPNTCVNASSSTNPYENFLFLWQSFSEYYPDFDERLNKKETWDKLKHQFKNKLQPNMKSKALYKVLGELLLKLHDGHVNLYFGDDNIDSEPTNRKDILAFRHALEVEYGAPYNSEIYNDKLFASVKKSFNNIDKHYLANAHHALSQSMIGDIPVITWGVLKDKNDVGYFRIIQELNLESTTPISEKKEVALFKKYIGQAFESFKKQNIKTIIIDVRVNFGGEDSIGRYIAGYFVSKKTLAQKRYAYINGTKQQAKNIYIYPNKNRFEKVNTIVLTSSITYSAGENFAMTMRATNHSKQIGYATYGIFADEKIRELPNGWLYTLPFFRYTDAHDNFYGGVGVQPDVEIKPNYLLKKYLDKNDDPVIDAIFQDNI